MVDAWTVAENIAETVAFLAATPLLWLFLYLYAWNDEDRARVAGFGRTTFWLLVAGGIVGALGDLPILPIGRYVLGINIAGGLIPLVLSAIFLSRLAPDSRPSVVRFSGLIAAETAGLLLSVIFLPAFAALLAVVVGAVLVSFGAVGLFGSNDPAHAVYGAGVAIVSGVIVATYLVTATDVGLGIVSQFPYYLFAPIAAGVAAVAVAQGLGLPRLSGLPLAYATSTIGVLIGADVLRQPPLYGPGTGEFYVIGGAGPLDLLYLSGLLALVAAWAFERATRPSSVPAPVPERLPRPGPEALLRNAVQKAMAGDPEAATRLAGEAADVALARARLLMETPGGSAERPWAGFAVPSWIDLDHRNLRALVESKERRPRDAARAWWTARWLVHLARDVERPRFARSGARLSAGVVDFGLPLVPAVVLWVAIVLTSSASAATVLTSAWFLAAAVGYAAWAFLYFAVSETLYGDTLGKRLFHLAVTDRSLGRPRPAAALLRNLPKLVPLLVIGELGATFVALWLRGSGGLTGIGLTLVLPIELVSLLLGLLFGVGIPTAVGGFVYAWTPERQRVGDLLAGTWVVTAGPKGVPPTGASGAVSAPSSSG